MARMTRTIISIPKEEKRWLESYARRQRISSAEVVRLAVREFRRQKTGKRLSGALQETAGTWTSVTGETREHVDELRAEWERTPGASAGGNTVKEGRSPYGSPLPADLTDMAELRQRALAAAGRLESAVPDLSAEHDRYLVDEQAEDGVENGRQAQGGAKKDGGSR